MNTDKEEVSILKFIPENLHAQLKLEVLRQIELDKQLKPGEMSEAFKQVMDAKKKEREQQNKK